MDDCSGVARMEPFDSAQGRLRGIREEGGPPPCELRVLLKSGWVGDRTFVWMPPCSLHTRFPELSYVRHSRWLCLCGEISEGVQGHEPQCGAKAWEDTRTEGFDP